MGSQSHFCRVYGNGNLQLVGAKRDFEATGNDAVEAERASSRANDDDENGANARKKLRLSKEQSTFLEESFKEHNTLNPKQKLALAKQLNLRPRQVEVWFQNRRARTKLKQTWQMEEDHEGEDERYDPDSNMDVDDERKPLPSRVKNEFPEPEAKDMEHSVICHRN